MTEPRTANADRLADFCALCLGILLTLVIRGYQFGQSNHTVYLLDALRVNNPHLLANDWFATHTYQYHFVFAHVTAWLMRIGIVRPAFLVGYLLLVVAWHVAWLRIVQALSGERRAYLLSVLFFFLSAGGLGLGVYAFLQDASFLPSNIANVAMLWGIYLWIIRRPAAAGFFLGIAGFFHLNHAVVCVVMWFAMLPFSGEPRVPSGRPFRGRLAGTIALLVLCFPNVIPAARIAMQAQHHMALEDFVNLYVRLRHPHHYDPSSWPIALWVSFLWPFPLAFLYARRLSGPAARRARHVFLLLCGLVAFGLVFAGIWYVSETIVQMSLARFSIYLKLLSCVGAAAWVAQRPQRAAVRWAVLLGWAALLPLTLMIAPHLNAPARAVLADSGVALLLVWLLGLEFVSLVFGVWRRNSTLTWVATASGMLVIVLVNRRAVGMNFRFEPGDAAGYLAVCDYARDHTPTDAIFLVPPSEEQFRLRAERAIVVNFKGVPQFSGELIEWRHRLCDVLDLDNLNSLPHRFDRALSVIANDYNQLPAQHLAGVARLYRARYVVTSHPVAMPAPARSVFESGGYHLYDLAP